MSEEHRHKLENEAKSWLQIQTFKAAVEIGAGRVFIYILFLILFVFLILFSCKR
jgi:hypothetical protein